MRILGHRGTTLEENTFNSITNITNIAKKYPRFWGVEFDIQMTKYGKIVCYHDKTLKRLHGMNIDLYDVVDPNELNICSLDDILNYFMNYPQIYLNIEMKIYDNLDIIHTYCNAVISKIKSRCMENVCLISSFNKNIVNTVAKSYDNVGLIIDKIYDYKSIYECINTGINTLIVHKAIINNIMAVYKNIDIYVYTLYENYEHNEDDMIDTTYIKGIITDDLSHFF